MKKRIQELKRAKKEINDSFGRLVERATNPSDGSKRKVVEVPPGAEKMSDVIIDFARPLLEHTKNTQEEKKAIQTAILCWNLSFLPKGSQTKSLDKIKESLSSPDSPDQAIAEFDEIVEFLLDRKQSLFPEINRMIVDYEFVDTPRGVHLNVVSNIS